MAKKNQTHYTVHLLQKKKKDHHISPIYLTIKRTVFSIKFYNLLIMFHFRCI